MALIRKIGADGAARHALEFAGQAIADLDIDGRMTICNVAVEYGARVALMVPDETVMAAIAGKPKAPDPAMFERAGKT